MTSSSSSSTIVPPPPVHGLAMLQAASIVLADESASVSASRHVPSSSTSSASSCTTVVPTSPVALPEQNNGPLGSLSALLNPAPLDIAASLPSGFVLGKDGKIKKKRGRKPTPGLSDEDRRKARLLKNRRTAEISRRRKLAQLNKLTEERDCTKRIANELSFSNQYLMNKLASVLGTTIDDLIKSDHVLQNSNRNCQQLSQLNQSEQVSRFSNKSNPNQLENEAEAIPHSDVSTHGSDDDGSSSPSHQQNTNETLKAKS